MAQRRVLVSQRKLLVSETAHEGLDCISFVRDERRRCGKVLSLVYKSRTQSHDGVGL
jgi:hypothetical protein